MNDLKRYTVHITGIVQGVGMRPCIYKTAKQYGLRGWVSNHGTAVVMEIAGSKKAIGEFLKALLKNAPSGSKINNIKIKSNCYKAYDSFSIIHSSIDNQLQGFIPPDTAICDECVKEMKDKNNPRYMYPFTNCTSCGPRYSIIDKLPYDRANTSMTAFKMCPECRKEYENPDNRRFHAQTNCCPNCGPKLTLLDNKGSLVDSIDTVATAGKLLNDGKLIAIKGIGGYHIACNAYHENAISLLRKRKRRPDKPLAIIAASLEAAKLICMVTDKEEEILAGRQRPIVLLEKRLPELLPGNIAPGINRLGVMLPYTPLHHLLFHEELQYIVMTSGNISGMPICWNDGEALEKLKDIVDFFLVHDREILTPIDDSVVRVIDEKEVVSRNARGYSPFTLQIDSDSEIIAMGAEQKSSLCLLHRGYAHSTQYVGSLEEMNTYEEYLQVMKRMKALLGGDPKIFAHDLHTGYLSTQYAVKQKGEKISIQHHHAHMASCIAEHDLKEDAIGIIYDGTGMGTDGAIWGGEFLIGSKCRFSRVGHWKYITLQGGDNAVKQPWRSAASYLYAMDIDSRKLLNSVDSLKIKAVQNAISHNINCFMSSSMGRLFDCVSALVMKKMHITYDAQAAIELESIIDKDIIGFYSYSIVEKEEKLEIGYEEIIVGILKDIEEGKASSYISAKFHNTVCEATIDCVCKLRSKYGINNIILGGGVFENSYLLKNMKSALKKHDFHVYHNMKIPINDGGIAFGQAAATAEIIKEGIYVSGSSSKDCNS
ncbi:MAG: carbamoyltransferase HypF [Solirubrobacterales bacterium]